MKKIIFLNGLLQYDKTKIKWMLLRLEVKFGKLSGKVL
jgi:hypothetical protein